MRPHAHGQAKEPQRKSQLDALVGDPAQCPLSSLGAIPQCGARVYYQDRVSYLNDPYQAVLSHVPTVISNLRARQHISYLSLSKLLAG